MKVPRTDVDLQGLIAAQVEESLTLEYKGAAALAKLDKEKSEITKDVSAMANSAGGVIIYGIAEGDTQETKHLPARFSPVDRTQHTREWLDQVCARIQPKIDGLEIVPVKLASGKNHVAYVVSIPKGETAHQAADKRYYKRSNFVSTPMEDYEVRDVMNRLSFAKIELEAQIISDIKRPSAAMPGYPVFSINDDPRPHHVMHLSVINRGKALAQHIVCAAIFPEPMLHSVERHTDGTIQFNNHVPQDTGHRDGVGGQRLGNPQWLPVLPELSMLLRIVHLRDDFHEHAKDPFEIQWAAFCDTSPPQGGKLTSVNVKRIETEAYRLSRKTE